jgi:hypothetical protein
MERKSLECNLGAKCLGGYLDIVEKFQSKNHPAIGPHFELHEFSPHVQACN